MIRVVLAVTFAVALLSVGLQAAEHGRQSRAGILADERVASLASTIERFAATNDPVPPGREGATLVARLRVPDGVVIVLGKAPDRQTGGRIAWRSVGSADDRHGRPVDADLQRPVQRGALELHAGEHRLRFSLVRDDGHAAVSVRRFTNESGTTPRHAGILFGEGGRRLPM